jgi:MtrB/PioB family decaheme-associated outer membrane protein
MKLGADYRLPKGARLSGGYDYDNHERTFQEVDETTEHTLWGRIVTRLTDKVHLTAKAAHAERDADAQQAVAEIDPPQNPLMTKYNLADRTRDSLALHAQLTPMERLSVGLGLDLADDDYTDSALGLTASQEWTLSADASLMVGDNTTLYMFFNHQKIESEQRGSQAFAVADWTLENDDTINTLGLGIKHRLVEKKIDLGADIVFSRSIGEIDFASNVTPYPDLESKLTSIKLYADYRLRDAVTLRAVVWHQRYDTENWSLDGVTASTLPNGITFGETSQDYDVTAFLVSMRYAF